MRTKRYRVRRKVCLHCGKTFRPYARMRHKQVYCKKACSNAAEYLRRGAGYYRARKIRRTMERLGVEVER